jgi:dUTP pyrophosphatase
VSKVQVKIKKLSSDAVTPTYGSSLAAGFDLYATEDVTLIPGESRLIKTGLSMEIPEGFELQVRPRSGMSLKTTFRVANAPGTVDADYRGEICIIGESHKHFVVNKGDRVAQGVIAPIYQAEFVATEDLSSTDRGDGGFGSTGQ